MNRTLESIQDNTSIGAQALSSAAADLKQAGEAFRQQMDEAARDGGNVARASIEATGARIARLTDELTSKAGQQLMSPLGEIAAQMQEVANQVAGASADLRILSDGVRSGADATVEAAESVSVGIPGFGRRLITCAGHGGADGRLPTSVGGCNPKCGRYYNEIRGSNGQKRCRRPCGRPGCPSE